MARPDSLSGGLPPEDDMMMEDDGMGGEMDALVGEVITAAMPGIEAAIRDALNTVLIGGSDEAPPTEDEGLM